MKPEQMEYLRAQVGSAWAESWPLLARDISDLLQAYEEAQRTIAEYQETLEMSLEKSLEVEQGEGGKDAT